MAKTTKKRSARSKKSLARRQRRTGSQRNAASTVGKRSGTKQARAIEMLRSKEGTSIAALMDATAGSSIQCVAFWPASSVSV
jgi:hypothetical protein